MHLLKDDVCAQTGGPHRRNVPLDSRTVSQENFIETSHFRFKMAVNALRESLVISQTDIQADTETYVKVQRRLYLSGTFQST